MRVVTRRAALKHIACAFAAPYLAGCSRGLSSSKEPADQITEQERAAMAQVALAFTQKFNVPGLAVAIAHGGQIVYDQPFGVANRDTGDPVSAGSLFRIASVSKPITSAAIFSLIEKGKLNLSDKVFGDGAVFGNEYGKPPYGRFVTDITVDHLLTHTCGGWQNDDTDPMFRHPEMDPKELIGWTLDTIPLLNPPGTHFAYSNFGYCVLGRLIEKITGQPYADYARQAILSRCGITDMRISGNTLEQQAPNEVTYFGQNGENPYNMNVTRMDSHGGWLASASDLARFSSYVAGFGSTPGILKRETITQMVTPGPEYPPGTEVKYARGWNVRNDGKGNWWHGGSLPGTTTIMAHIASGYCWAALCNTRKDEIGGAIDNLVWEMARKVSAWHV